MTAPTMTSTAPEASSATPTPSMAKMSASRRASTKPKASSASSTRATSRSTTPSSASTWIGATSRAASPTTAHEHEHHQRRPLAPVRPLRGLGHVDEIDVRGQAPDVLGRALEQQRVAHAHRHLVELAPDVLVPAVDRQRVDAVAPAQAQRAQRAPHQPAARRDQRLHGRRAARAHAVDERHLARILEPQQLAHVGPQHDAVALDERHVGELAAQGLVAAQDVDDAHPPRA